VALERRAVIVHEHLGDVAALAGDQVAAGWVLAFHAEGVDGAVGLSGVGDALVDGPRWLVHGCYPPCMSRDWKLYRKFDTPRSELPPPGSGR
jgi:hypothetical protein